MRRSAAAALRWTPSLEVQTRLIQLTFDDDEEMRFIAANWLTRIAPARHAKRAFETLQAIVLNKNSHWVRISAAEDLAEIDSERAVEILLRISRDCESALIPYIEKWKHCEKEFLRLRNVDYGSPTFRQATDAAADAYCDIIIGNENHDTLSSILTVFGEIKSELAVARLLELALETSGLFASEAAKSLGQIGSMRAVDALTMLLESSDSHCRDVAADALWRISIRHKRRIPPHK